MTLSSVALQEIEDRINDCKMACNVDVVSDDGPIDIIRVSRRGSIGGMFSVVFFDRDHKYSIGTVKCDTKQDAVAIIRDFDHWMYAVAKAISSDCALALAIARGVT